MRRRPSSTLFPYTTLFRSGWLRLGVASRPAAAWNPIAGFGDEAGRLVWAALGDPALLPAPDRKSTRLNSSHLGISYAVFCLKKKKKAIDGRQNARIGLKFL